MGLNPSNLLASLDPVKVRSLLSSVMVDGPAKAAVAPQPQPQPTSAPPPQSPRSNLSGTLQNNEPGPDPKDVDPPMEMPQGRAALASVAPAPAPAPPVATTPRPTPPVIPPNTPQAPAFNPQTRMALSSVDPKQAAPTGGDLITNAGGPAMSPSVAPVQSTDASATPAAAPASNGGGFWSRLGGGLQKIAPYLQPATAHLAAAFGNRAPLEDYEHQQQLQTQNQLASQRENSAEQTAAINRQLLQKNVDNYQTPQQKSDLAVEQSLNEKAIQGMGSDGQIHTYQRDPKTKAYHEVTVASATPGGADTPITMPQPVSKIIEGTGNNGQEVGVKISKYGSNLGTIDNLPTPHSAGMLPGVGKIGALDFGGAGAAPPNPADYPGGKASPEFQATYRQFLSHAADAKQSKALQLAKERAVDMGENRQGNFYDPKQQADVVSTLARQERANPGQPHLSGSQSGALGISGKAATTSEIDTNLQAVNDALNQVTKLNGGGFGGFGHRAAFAAALSAGNARGGILNEVPGVGLANAGVEAAGQNALQPQEKNLVSTLRNLKQGAVSFKNILSANGVSDAQVSKLDAELPSEADILGGDPNYVRQKLQNFERIYRSVVSQYPEFVSKGQGARSVFGQQPGGTGSAPPTMPSTNAAPSGGFKPF